jgi:hypothetical protein
VTKKINKKEEERKKERETFVLIQTDPRLSIKGEDIIV